jgi:hypothetical protein
MESSKRTARAAGIMYLVLAITGMFGIMYVPSQIIVADDVAATMQNISTHPTLFRLGVISGLVGQVSFVMVGVLLYRLLKPVNPLHALAMLAFVLVAVPIAFVYGVFELAPFIMLGDDTFLKAFTMDQLNALAMIFFKLRNTGIQVVEVFWGLWLLPLGYCVYKSNLFPGILGIMLMVGSFGYVLIFIVNIVAPSYADVFSYATLVTTIAEFTFLFYLLIKGVKAESKNVYSSAI